MDDIPVSWAASCEFLPIEQRQWQYPCLIAHFFGEIDCHSSGAHCTIMSLEGPWIVYLLLAVWLLFVQAHRCQSGLTEGVLCLNDRRGCLAECLDAKIPTCS